MKVEQWQSDADAHCLTIALTGRDGDISLLRLNLKQVVNKSRNKCEQKYLLQRGKISLLFGSGKKQMQGKKVESLQKSESPTLFDSAALLLLLLLP